MKQIPVIVCLGVLLANLALPALGKDGPGSAEELRSRLEAGIKAKDTNAILGLVNWNGGTEKTKAFQVSLITSWATREGASVKLLPLPSDFELTNEMSGVRSFPNVQVQGLIQLQYTKNNVTNSVAIPYGKSAGAFYISGINQQTFDPNAKKSISLSFSVMGPGILDCSYVYVDNGAEKNGSFQCTNNWGKGFWGDYIKSCKLTRVSGSGSLQLMIKENGKIIFDSGMVDTNDVILYEKK